MKFSLSIRMKIIALVAAALVASLGVYLYVGTTLITNDKISYIYDHSLTEIRTVAERIESRARNASEVCRSIIAVYTERASSEDLAKKIFFARAKSTGMRQLALYKLPTTGELSELLAISEEGADPSESPAKILEDQGWDDAFFRANESAVGRAAKGRIPIAGVALTSTNEPIVFVALLEMADVLGQANKAFALHVVDAKGGALVTSTEGRFSATSLNALSLEIASGKFDSGVREWSVSDSQALATRSMGFEGAPEFIVGYQRVAGGKISIISLIAKSEAFATTSLLIKKSILIGLCIFLLTMGFALLFIKGLVRRIRELWLATQRVSDGDFGFRVSESKKDNDEVADLAISFNKMSGRITELLSETAVKARLEKELETAQVLQNRFFPAAKVEERALTVAGKVIPANECSGDWWYHATIGKHLVVVVGDVTGHGVSAALVTAAAHGAFTVLIEELGRTPEAAPDPMLLLTRMNSAVFAAGGSGEFVTMTFLVSVIDLETGTFTFSNASHRPAWIVRKNDSSAALGVISLTGANTAALGQAKDIVPEKKSVQLKPGDVLFWYTDGLLECETFDGKLIGRKDVLKAIQSLAEHNDGDATAICDGFATETLRLLGGESHPRADDITIVVAAVPSQGAFGQAGAPKKLLSKKRKLKLLDKSRKIAA